MSMSNLNLACITLACVALSATELHSQVVQLPTFRFFNVRTVVSVPDGGTISLGGVNRSSSGSVNRGVPGLSRVPGAGRLFGNRAIGGSTGSSRSSVSAKVIVMSEYEEAVLAEAERRRRKSALRDPNGSAAVQKKADFNSRNVGRLRKK